MDQGGSGLVGAGGTGRFPSGRDSRLSWNYPEEGRRAAGDMRIQEALQGDKGGTLKD